MSKPWKLNSWYVRGPKISILEILMPKDVVPP